MNMVYKDFETSSCLNEYLDENEDLEVIHVETVKYVEKYHEDEGSYLEQTIRLWYWGFEND